MFLHILAGKRNSSFSQNAVFFYLYSYNIKAVRKFTRYFHWFLEMVG